VAAVSLTAGGDAVTALRLGVSMTALQASIGTLNDVLDAPTDAGRKPGKPIPAGLISPAAARVVVVLTAATGLVLAAASGLGVLVLAGLVLAIGYGYDAWAKGTAWSWLPFAIGIPLLPVYGWYGATGGLADWFVVLLSAAVLTGAALAIGNARVDVERDRAAGRSSVAVSLGAETSWRAQAIAIGLVVVVAAVWLAVVVGSPGPLAWAGLAAAAVILAASLWWGRSAEPGRRERAWQGMTLGVAVLAIAWLIGVTGAGPRA
jgi:4-hydroxybenzoate polyprenyltransferase